ncbi:MAG: hypothetical protein A2X61_07565 [Ignavibacteria bacterium GWB2_35_12]|nr:MAG: hypothetical protein A2X63_12865 [Ignavibacteria bacterium GWA2_35_8]OGU39184.1 MAG: hypothetical protein A2X61_07565 [Ignavibacteria bacterium GWB2_35_12]OGU89212.1 MAG: hypothetical protein A2220_00955 [Ignavibacteria bacterium RIFOXYA2_FULL_35_10]OGV21050.1 MAG: hypothetical protein A2475_00855 [Ignavibacteria bacterium RIFOXYC2_FULL_35_21]
MKNLNNMRNLFTNEDDFQLIDIRSTTFETYEPFIKVLKELIIKNEVLYPNIDKWFKNKVIPGLKSGERIGYIGFIGKTPIAASILKISNDAKFCHLSIDENYSNINLGDLFFSEMALDCQRIAKDIHFTLPEGLWENKKDFFKSFGFREASKANTQYRTFENELRCSADLRNVLENVKIKLPKIISQFTKYSDDIFNGVLFSIHPKFIQKIENGEKSIELRTRFNKKYTGRRAILYSTSPNKEIYGYAIIDKVIEDNPSNVWLNFKYDIGCSEEEFVNYTQNHDIIYAIKFKEYQSYRGPIPLTQLNYLLNKELRPPQSYLDINKSKDWSEAISFAELLHGRFHVYNPLI